MLLWQVSPNAVDFDCIVFRFKPHPLLALHINISASFGTHGTNYGSQFIRGISYQPVIAVLPFPAGFS